MAYKRSNRNYRRKGRGKGRRYRSYKLSRGGFRF